MAKKAQFKTQKKISTHQVGFSLVELLVVVAILGALSTIAIPLYDRFSFKAKESDAKLQLAGLYSAEKNFYANFLAYHSSLIAIGYAPEGNSIFNVGFGSAGTSATVANGFNDSGLDPLYSSAISTKYYCNYAGQAPSVFNPTCTILRGYNSQWPPAIDASFTVTSSNFFATAVTEAPSWAEYHANGASPFSLVLTISDQKTISLLTF